MLLLLGHMGAATWLQGQQYGSQVHSWHSCGEGLCQGRELRDQDVPTLPDTGWAIPAAPRVCLAELAIPLHVGGGHSDSPMPHAHIYPLQSCNGCQGGAAAPFVTPMCRMEPSCLDLHPGGRSMCRVCSAGLRFQGEALNYKGCSTL